MDENGPRRRTAETDRDGTSLPAGKTCGDCAFIVRCEWLIGQLPRDEVCDFAPSRFRERIEAAGRIG